MKTHDQEYVAYHEAGHVLLCILFNGDLKSVTLPMLRRHVSGYRYGYVAETKCAEVEGSLESDAYYVVGKLAGAIFCNRDCKTHAQADAYDQTQLSAGIKSNPQKLVALEQALQALLQRHQPQHEAIAKALIERKTLTGSEVFEIMFRTGWNPNTDSDPVRFYKEVGADNDGATALLRAKSRFAQFTSNS